MQYCEGSFVDYVKTSLGGKMPETAQQQYNPQQAFQGQMMGCEKVDKGINKQGVCGNECCEERYGESYYSCPSDCMAPQQQQAGQQPMTQRALQVVKEGMQGGCSDVANGLKPKDVCGNGCCEPNEGGNCLQDCNAMQRPPMYDQGQFFNQQRGPAPTGQQVSNTQVQGVVQMPQEPVNMRGVPIESTPTQGEVVDIQQPPTGGCTTYPDGSVSCAIPPPTNGGGGGGGSGPVITEPPGGVETAATETTSGGGGGMAAGAVVVIDAIKEILGR